MQMGNPCAFVWESLYVFAFMVKNYLVFLSILCNFRYKSRRKPGVPLLNEFHKMAFKNIERQFVIVRRCHTTYFANFFFRFVELMRGRASLG